MYLFFAVSNVQQLTAKVSRLQQVLGHTNINTTAVYLQFNDQDLQDVYANVPFWKQKTRLNYYAGVVFFQAKDIKEGETNEQ